MADGGKRLLRELRERGFSEGLDTFFFLNHNRSVLCGGITSAFNSTPRLENVG